MNKSHNFLSGEIQNSICWNFPRFLCKHYVHFQKKSHLNRLKSRNFLKRTFYAFESHRNRAIISQTTSVAWKCARFMSFYSYYWYCCWNKTREYVLIVAIPSRKLFKLARNESRAYIQCIPGAHWNWKYHTFYKFSMNSFDFPFFIYGNLMK